MANESIERAVDDLIARGRVQRELRDEYIAHFESNLQSDLLRGSDYTNKTKTLAEERRAAEQKIQQDYQKLQAERARLEQWQHQVQGELSKLDALPEMSAKLAAYEQALRDYQIYDQVQVPTVPKTPNQNYQPVQQRQDPPQQGNRFMTVETAGAALRDFALLQSKVNRIQLEHQRLFGEPMYDDLITHYLETGQDPEEHWKVKYAVDNKRHQVQEQNRVAEIARIKEETRAEVMREMALDPGRVTGSPLGKQPGGLTPVLETYSSSRALSHSQPHANDKAPVGQAPTDFIPPERKADIAASRERVAAASRMFAEHFDITGNPTTEQGRKLSRIYNTE